jgi:sugar lactone lactonase YvrE
MSVRILGREAVVPVHQANAMTGEAPFWDDRTGTLWWIDIQGQRLLGFSPDTGREQVFNLPSTPGLVAAKGESLVVGLEDGLYEFDPLNGLGSRLVPVEVDDPRTRINDGKVDRQGRLWFGTMEKTGARERVGRLYRLDLDGSLRAFRSEVAVPNAIAFAPDGTSLYFTDSRTRVVEVMDYDQRTGDPGAARTFVRYESSETPDGACVDVEGAVWIAVVEGARIERRLPNGTLDTVVELPVSRPTMPLLGGADRRTLFVTSQRRFLSAERLKAEPLAGDLLAVRVDVPGCDPLLHCSLESAPKPRDPLNGGLENMAGNRTGHRCFG